MLNLERLNEAQRRAVTYGEGPLLVLAGPGSGKTTVVVQRINYLLEKRKVSPEKILVLTFTKEAALSMQSRFCRQAGIGKGAGSPVNFGTFHSVFYQILRKSHVLQSNNILSAAQKKELLLPLVGKYCGEEQGAEFLIAAGRKHPEISAVAEQAVVAELLGAIGYYKNTGDMEAAKRKVLPKRRKSFENIFREYERARNDIGGMDFDDMVYECGKMLEEDKTIRSFWQERFDYILLDEFQDINPCQYRVVSLLSKPPYSLFAVGDDDQSIYGFRGADFSCLKRFEEDYGAERQLLGINYRSRQEIVDSSLKVIEENKNRYSKKLYSWKEAYGEYQDGEKEKHRRNVSVEETAKPAGISTADIEKGIEPRNKWVQVISFGTQKEQYHYVAKRLEQRAKDKSRAVLFRTNMQMQRFAVTLDKLNIPYIMKEKSESIYEHFIVKDIMAYLWLAAGEWSRESFLRIMNKPCRYISREAVGINVKNISQMLHHIRTGESVCRTDKQQALKELERLQKQLCRLEHLSLYLGVQYIRRAVGYDVYLRRLSEGSPDRYDEWQEILDWLGEDAFGYESLKKWSRAQKSFTQGLQHLGQSSNGLHEKHRCGDGLYTEQACGAQDTAIRLMTVHGAKGLEFESVWLPDCNEGIYPHGNLCSTEEYEEERRIFYVAMTRAKENLELSYLIGTGKRSRLPSRFLNPLL